MKIILDESVPRYLKKVLSSFDVVTVQEAKLAGVKNGVLLETIDATFNVFITADKNLKYQQNLKDRKVAIIEIHSNKLSEVKRVEKRIVEILTDIKASEYIEVKPIGPTVEKENNE